MDRRAAAGIARLNLGDGNEKRLLEVIRTENPAHVVEFLAALEPRDRRKLNSFLKRLFKLYSDPEFYGQLSIQGWNCLLALLGTSTPTEAGKRRAFLDLTDLDSWSGPLEEEAREAVVDLCERINPALAGAFLDRGVARQMEFLFAAEERGLLEFPTSEEFHLAIITSDVTLEGSAPFEARSLFAFFDRYPQLLEPTAFAIFDALDADELDQWNLAVDEDSPAANWMLFLLDRIAQGKLPPPRVFFEKCLGALTRCGKPDLARWYWQMREELQSVLDSQGQQSERQGLEMEHLPNLVASENKSVRSGALKRLSALAKEDVLPDAAVLDRIGQSLGMLPKTGAKTVLGVLRKLAETEPARRAHVLQVALEGLLHPESDVQLAVVTLLESFRDDLPGDFEERVAMLGDGLAPSLRPAMEALGANFVDLEPPQESAPEDVLVEPAELVPLTDAEELVRLASHQWHRAEELSADEYERLLGGLVRTAGPDLAKAGLFLDGLIDLLQGGEESALLGSGRVLELVLGTWVTCALPSWKPEWAVDNEWHPNLPFGDKLRRAYEREVARAIEAAQGREWLAEPTHEGGWIDPAVLVERVRIAEHCAAEVGELEIAVALLRLNDEGRAKARRAAKDLSSQAGVALRYALGDSEPPREERLWLAAQRSRAPGTVPDRAPDAPAIVGPAAWEEHELLFDCGGKRDVRLEAIGAGVSWELSCLAQPAPLESLRTELPPVLYVDWAGRWCWSLDALVVSWMASLWPAHPEPFLYNAFNYLCRSMTGELSQAVQRSQCAIMQAVAGWPHGELGYHVTWLGLSVEGKSGRAAATDTVITNLLQPWFRVAEFGESAGALLQSNVLILNRVVPQLREIASISRRHHARLRDALLAIFRRELTATPRLLASLLDLLHEMSVADPPSEAPAVPGLRAITGKGKAAVLARKICARLDEAGESDE